MLGASEELAYMKTVIRCWTGSGEGEMDDWPLGATPCVSANIWKRRRLRNTALPSCWSLTATGWTASLILQSLV